MFARFSRRNILRSGIVAGLTVLAGCGQREPSPTTDRESETPSRTDTSTPSPTMTDTPTTTPSPTPSASLPTLPDSIFRSDIQRTGYWPDRTVPDAVELAWSIPGINKGDHSAAKSSPLVYDGAIITPGDVGTVFSFSPAGDLNWARALHPSGFGTHATPAIVAGTVYTTAYDGAVYAIDAASGTLNWRTKVADAIGSSPAYYDGVLYVATEFYDPSGGMVALDAVTGDLLWEDNRMTDHAHSITGIDPVTGTFAAGCNDGDLYVWDLETREFRGRFETGNAIKGPICIHDGTAIFGSWDERIYAVDLEELSTVWTVKTPDFVMSGAGVHPELGAAYIGGHDHEVRSIDIASGDVRWTYDTGGLITGSPVVTPETVLVGSYDDTLYAFDADTGEVRWEFGVPDGWVTSSPAIHDDAIYFTERATDDTTGHLYKLTAA
ncbi:MAG: PQQ-binding-like beta-propeller repeat protein [Halobacteriales archaeon]|nr:PQQ-binding-like beta-propeller repeat protein [Halobacteriales archaeon]